MPFRFTRQFRALFQPLDTDGLLKQDMVYTLNALKQHKDTLLTIMDVFIKEPQLDWVNAAKSSKSGRAQAHHHQPSSSSSLQSSSSLTAPKDDVSWLPKNKIAVAKSKLDGVHPSLVMAKEFHESRFYKQNRKAFEKCLSFIAGAPDQLRAKLKCTSVEEQVDCLVDQATDPNILGRTWTGWLPFM